MQRTHTNPHVCQAGPIRKVLLAAARGCVEPRNCTTWQFPTARQSLAMLATNSLLGCTKPQQHNASSASDAQLLAACSQTLTQLAKSGTGAGLGAIGGLAAYLAHYGLREAVMKGATVVVEMDTARGGASSASASSSGAPAGAARVARPVAKLQIDSVTVDNLEVWPCAPALLPSQLSALGTHTPSPPQLERNSFDGGAAGTLLGFLDHCVTAAGRRLLRSWLLAPLADPAAIHERQAAVADLCGSGGAGAAGRSALESLRASLKAVGGKDVAQSVTSLQR